MKLKVKRLQKENKTLERTFVFPLENLRSDIEELIFDDKLKLRQLSEHEYKTIFKLRKAIYPVLAPVSVSRCLEATASNITGAINQAYLPISAIRLHKIGSVGTRFFLSREFPNYVIPLSPQISFMAPALGIQYFLDIHEYNKLKQLYALLIPLKKDLKFARALRRFNMGISETEFEDKLLSYIIGLETLLLTGGPEKAFRLATSTTIFLDDSSPTKTIEIWNYIRDAYRLRSAIIHSGKPLPQKVKIKEIGNESPEGIVLKLEEYLRSALKKYIQIKHKNPDLNIPETIERSIWDSSKRANIIV